jgi:WD40 repeat protein
VAILEGHEGWPRALAVSADGCELASVDDKSGVRIWRTAGWTLMREVRSARGTDICFNPAGDRFTTALHWSSARDDPLRQILRIWNSREGTLIAEHRVPGFEFQIVRYSADGSQLACGLEAVDDIRHQEADLLDAQSGRVLRRLRAPFDWFTDFVFLPARNAIALGVSSRAEPALLFAVDCRDRTALGLSGV